jgi:hypothetical protein
MHILDMLLAMADLCERYVGLYGDTDAHQALRRELQEMGFTIIAHIDGLSPAEQANWQNIVLPEHLEERYRRICAKVAESLVIEPLSLIKSA